MLELNRKIFDTTDCLDASLVLGTSAPLKEKVLQFGEGNFLRAFVDFLIDELNSKGIFNGGIVVAQPINQGMVHIVNEQEGLYTAIARGLEGGKPVSRKKLVTSVTRGINPYAEFDAYFECIKNPDLRFIVSNTTEAGISYKEGEKLEDKPQASFPGKVCALLYERFKAFNGDASKGLIFIPCELIDYNGDTLRKIVLQYAEEWGLEEAFTNWVKESNLFVNTLVDRIVTGYPRDEAEEICNTLGYKDKLLVTSEAFLFWALEAPTEWLPILKEELPLHKTDYDVVFTEDVTNYKARKVRILNGSHTATVLGAYLAGFNTVGEVMEDKLFNAYLKKALFDEIIPTLTLDYNDLKSFADAVFDRFANPFIKHYLLSISLNSVSKFKARVMPSILEYYRIYNKTPNVLTFSFAALAAFYKGGEIVDGALIGSRNGQEYKICDDIPVLTAFQKLWAENGSNLDELSTKLCAREDFWGTDLNKLEGFSQAVAHHLKNIEKNSIVSEVKRILC